MMSAMSRSAVLGSAVALALSVSLASAPAFAGKGSGGGGGGGSDRVRLECSKESLGADESMSARFEVKRGRMKFDASYEAAFGGSTGPLDVEVGGVIVDLMDLAPDGVDMVGDVSYDSELDELAPFPAGFPEVSAGTVVKVGELGCKLTQ